jgi:hypothetical protein
LQFSARTGAKFLSMVDHNGWIYQGRQGHGWFGSGTAPSTDHAAETGVQMAQNEHATTATHATDVAPGPTDAPVTPYVAANPRQWIGQPQVGDDECVALGRRATGAPPTREWQQGDQVERSSGLPPGTLVATFDHGRYGNHTDQTSHAVLLISKDADGFWGVEQYNIRDSEGRIIARRAPRRQRFRFNNDRGPPIGNGSNYYVVR